MSKHQPADKRPMLESLQSCCQKAQIAARSTWEFSMQLVPFCRSKPKAPRDDGGRFSITCTDERCCHSLLLLTAEQKLMVEEALLASIGNRQSA
eukprot:scaffold29298_cov152-Skeletonema_dohrnii-CCMP3373.AAC.8